MSISQDTQTYAPGQHPDMPPPLATRGVIGWMRKNLFSSIGNTILTLVAIAILWRIVPPILDYFVFDAVINASNREECVAKGTGACWAVISERFQVSLYAFYPETERWRLKLTFLLLFVALGPVLFDRFPARKQMIWFSLAYPFIAIWLVVGGFLGLPLVETKMFGGVMLTLIIGITGITVSLPIGILLALGRISDLPAMQIISVAFIEFIRGVPLITLLFVASTMLNYFLPPGTEFDLLLRVLIMVTLFASAYIAEVVRGGLQAIPKGQYEAADAMGLKYWQAMRLIILPQALKISIPGIVNTFIGLYKDTTLVLIIGLFDVLGIMRSALADPKWNGLSTEVYIYTALFFFVSCFAMSRYSLYLEKKLHTGHER